MKPVVIYHDHCMDGMGAAWAAWKHFNGDVELIAADYGQQPPHLIDRQVFIVDFSYSLPVLQHMGATNNVMVIDHHKTAAKDLAMLHSAGTIADFDAFCDQGGGVIRVLFDMERSGAGLTWDFFNPGMPRPYLIDRIEDRDLWKFHYESSRPLHSYLSSFVFSMEMFDDTMVRFEDTGHRLFRKAEGVAIDRMHMKRCRELVKESLQRVDVRHGEYLVINQVPIVNAPYFMASDIGKLLTEVEGGPGFGIVWCDLANCRKFSLRSTDAGPDVGAIAKHYGGGGHRNACGFTKPLGWWFGQPQDAYKRL